MHGNDEHSYALRPGTMIHEYEIIRCLGHGGFGITYLAHDTQLHMDIAIKEYLPVDLALRVDDSRVVAKTSGVAKDFEWGLDAFIKEARMLAQFKHPNIVQASRFIKLNSTAYIVMEYVDGQTLEAAVKESRTGFSEDSVKWLVDSLANGLREVHQKKIYHRDIKPANILLRKDGTPVLIDFGAARQMLEGKSRPMTAIVTAGYAPLEQYNTQGAVGPWTDIYALSAVVYFCLTGQPPDEATDRILDDQLKPLAGEGGSRFLQAIDMGLALNARFRPQTLKAWQHSYDVGQGGAGAITDDTAEFSEGINSGSGASRSDGTRNKPRPKSMEATPRLLLDRTIVSQITKAEATRGASFMVEAGDEKLRVHVPAGASNGQKLRLKRQGRKNFDGTQRGDLYVKLAISDDSESETPLQDKQNKPVLLLYFSAIAVMVLFLIDQEVLEMEREEASAPAVSEPDYVDLVVRSNVTNDMVYVDGVAYRETGPDAIQVEAGYRNVKVTKENYSSWEKSIQVKEDGSTVIKAVLQHKNLGFTNNCHKEMQLAIHYRNTRTGNWESDGWWIVEPEEGTWLTGRDKKPVWVTGDYLYFYGEVTDGDYPWSGEEEYDLNGETLQMRKKNLTVSNDYKEFSVTCPNLE